MTPTAAWSRSDSRLGGLWFHPDQPQEVTLDLRQPWLKPGTYTVDVFLCRVGIVDVWDGAVTFDVEQGTPYAVTGTAESFGRGMVCCDGFRCAVMAPHTVIGPPGPLHLPRWSELWEAREGPLEVRSAGHPPALSPDTHRGGLGHPADRHRQGVRAGLRARGQPPRGIPYFSSVMSAPCSGPSSRRP